MHGTPFEVKPIHKCQESKHGVVFSFFGCLSVKQCKIVSGDPGGDDLSLPFKQYQIGNPSCKGQEVF